MIADRFARLDRLLDRHDQAHRLRRLQPRIGLDFASNDYLGLAEAPRLRNALAAALERGVPHGAGGSRLLRGNHPEHEALEAEAAAFFGAPACLLFGSGYAANTALLAALPGRDDLVIHDMLVHASVHDGLRASRARIVTMRHNDATHCAAEIAAWRAGGGRGVPWIVVESLYSMDGDIAPLAALAQIAAEQDGFLVVDEAHATGVFGDGRGLTPHAPHVISLHTGGKALGLGGALVAADRRVIALLVNQARPFVFATAPSPLLAAGLREALRMVRDEPERRTALAARIGHAATRLRALGLPVTDTQILPVIVGDSARALRVAARLRDNGIDARAIRPPTVPDGTARIRLSLTLNVDQGGIDRMVGSLAGALAA